MTTFVNLTPHKIDFQFPDGTRVEFPSLGLVRAEIHLGSPKIIKFGDREMSATPLLEYGGLLGLPEPKEDTVYIVSEIVISHPDVAGRKDIVAPATGPGCGAIRYADGPQKGQIDAVTQWLLPKE